MDPLLTSLGRLCALFAISTLPKLEMNILFQHLLLFKVLKLQSFEFHISCQHLYLSTCCDWKFFQDKANPLATVLSAAMLLRYGLGEESAAKRIENAVLETLDRGYRTGDIFSAGSVSLLWNFLVKNRISFSHRVNLRFLFAKNSFSSKHGLHCSVSSF